MPRALYISLFPSRLSLSCLALFRKIVSLYDYMSKLSCSFERRQYIQQRDLVWPLIMKVEMEMERQQEEVRIESHVMLIVPLEN